MFLLKNPKLKLGQGMKFILHTHNIPECFQRWPIYGLTQGKKNTSQHTPIL